MQTNIEPALAGVSETLMIPLWCRAIESERRRGLLRDPKAQAIVASLDYDFEARFGGQRGVAFRACLRTRMFDLWVEDFLRRNPEGTVVELGTGLNTRFERIDNGRLHWFDVDLPDSMALRRRFFKEQPRRRMVVGAFGSDEWVEALADAPRPLCFVSEAVLVYLEEATVRRGLSQLAAVAPGSEFIFDTVRSAVVAAQLTRMMKHFEAPFVWGCDDSNTIEGWGDYRLLESATLFELPAALRRRLPMKQRLMHPLMQRFQPERLNAYALNRFALRPDRPDRPDHGGE